LTTRTLGTGMKNGHAMFISFRSNLTIDIPYLYHQDKGISFTYRLY
jgi:hypothetical protein